LQALLNENSVRTLEELTKALNVDKLTISDCLRNGKDLKKKDKWVPHELSKLAIQNHLTNHFALYCFLVIKISNFFIKL